MNEDPYVYPGTNVLINREDIRDRDELDAFERIMTANRMEHLPRAQSLSYESYKRLHLHIFAPVYAWAGEPRTVNIAKGGHMFCLVPFIAQQMRARFTRIQADQGLIGSDKPTFADRAAEHICEINAIHPFREGNGRTQRALLLWFGDAAGITVALERISPGPWIEASIASFRDADYGAMRQIILEAIS